MNPRELEEFTQMVDYLIDHYEGVLEAYNKSKELAKSIEVKSEELEAHTRATLSAQKIAQESAQSAKVDAELTKSISQELTAKINKVLCALGTIKNAIKDINFQSILKEIIEEETLALYPKIVDTLIIEPNFARLKEEVLNSLNTLKNHLSELSVLNQEHAQKAQESAQSAKASELSAKESAERARAIAFGDIQEELERFFSGKIAQTLSNLPDTIPDASPQKRGLLSAKDKQKLDRLKFDETQQFVTREQIQRWDNKAEKRRATTSEDGLMSKEDKQKLDGFAHKDNSLDLFKTLLYIRELRRQVEERFRQKEELGKHAYFLSSRLPKGYALAGSTLEVAKHFALYARLLPVYKDIHKGCARGFFTLPRAGVFIRGAKGQEVGQFQGDSVRDIDLRWYEQGWNVRRSPEFGVVAGSSVAGNTYCLNNNMAGHYSIMQMSLSRGGRYPVSDEIRPKNITLLEGYYIGGEE